MEPGQPNLRQDDYELLDFGDARRLERFGPAVLDRPCPAAEGVRRASPRAWARATARFDRAEGETGGWTPKATPWSPWEFTCEALRLELRATDFGHVGLFPEHRTTWGWIGQSIRHADRPLKVLNLFAYTGGATLAAAACGAEVVHVDAARSVVQWARRNAALSGLTEAPIRWIVEDAAKFTAREVKRGARYDGVILDPPSYGHGPSGRPWKIEEHLPALLATCGRLIAESSGFVLLTCHTTGYDGDVLADLLAEHKLAARGVAIRRGELVSRTSAGRELPSGSYAWLPGGR